MLTSMQEELSLKSSVPVANAAEMVAYIVAEVAGNDIATSLNGVVQTRDAIVNLATARIVNGLYNKMPAQMQVKGN